MIDVHDLFPGIAGSVYLNTASQALGNRPAAEALDRAVAEWTRGEFDWVAAEAVGEELRRRVAALLRVDADALAFVAGASGGAATVAAQLPEGGPGANVVVPARDFASNFVPWQLLRGRGYELRTVADVGGALAADSFTRLVDSGTAVVATSIVQSATGYRADLDALKTIAAEAGAWLVLDASQALGGIDIDVEGVDALFSCSHKWTLGIRGIGHLYVRPDLRDSFEPVTPGWKAVSDPMGSFYGPDLRLSEDTSKLDASWPWFNPIVDIEGIRIIERVGISAIESHNLALVAELEERGVPVAFPPANRSPIVSIGIEDTEATTAALENERIFASARAGKLRVSMHLYNTSDDIARLAEAIHSVGAPDQT